jgi:peptidoglycan-binding protein ArfA
MTGSDDARARSTAPEWRRESRYYRRSPGWGWLLGLLLIPLLFGWLGWGSVRPTAAVEFPSVTPTAPSLPAMSVPELNLAPLSIVRNGKDFTLTGELPDLSVKDKLLSTLKTTLGPGINLIDRLSVKAGVSAPDSAAVSPVFTAANDIADFSFNLADGALTLAGTAPSEEVKAGVEAAARAAWPNVRIVNSIEVRTATGDAASCDNLQADIIAALRSPIAYQTEGSGLTAGSQTELTAVAAAIKACPQAKVTVVGHTDNTGDDEVNVPLSKSRAESVADYLVSQGVPAGSVTAEGAGSSRPVAGNDTADGRAQNRRTEIIVN